MFRHIFKIHLSIFIITSITACTFFDKGSSNKSDNKYYDGDLEIKFKEIYSKDNESLFEQCDFNNRTLIFEISRALNQKKEAIDQFYKEIASSKDVEKIFFGKYQFLVRDVEKIAPNEWKEKSISWDQIIKLYLEIKTMPVNFNWAYLNKLVRGIVFDDENRLHDAVFMGVKHDSESMLRNIKEKISDCLSDSTCVKLEFSEMEKRFLKISKIFDFYLYYINDSDVSLFKKREKLLKFEKWISFSLKRFDF